MKIIEKELNGVLLIEPAVYNDDRGYFFESFKQEKFNEITGTNYSFVQDNQSCSGINVARGLHFQSPPYAQAKIVRVITGKALDIVMDIRKKSPTFGKCFTAILSGENKRIMWVPEGFAHGFISMEENTIFHYKCSNYYSKESQGTILFNEVNGLSINDYLLSDKDSNGISLNEYKTINIF